MTIEAAIGRIDQIYTLRQQLTDPAALVGGSSTTSPSGGASLTAGSTSAIPSTDFATALATAQGTAGTSATPGASELAGAAEMPGAADPTAASTLSALTDPTGTSALTGLSSLTGVAGLDGTTAGGLPTQVQSMIDQANSLLGKPYVWGGGHSGWGPQAGYDCSGFVSAVLHAGGYLSAPQDTQTLPGQPGIEPGPGQYVTIYDRTDAGGNDHVIIDLGGQFYESGGESGSWGGGGGVEKIGTPSAAYLATFNDVLHPEGL